MSGGGGGGITGFSYYFGIFMGFGRGPVDELIQVKVGDRTAWAGSIKTNGTIAINAPELFGGKKGEGGIVGPLKVMFGESDQLPLPELEEMAGTSLPGFRRVFTAFFDGLISQLNPYPKPWKFRVRRALRGWDGDCWYPEQCVIPLIRPTYPGEVGGESSDSFDDTQNLVSIVYSNLNGMTLRAPLPLIEGAIITEIQALSYFSGGEDGSQIDIPTDDITIDGLDLVFPDGTLAGFPLTVQVAYSVTYTSGGNAIGTSLILAMNPAHIIYEALTNREWGRGLDRAEIDDVQWRQTADTLSVEKFGLCLKWSRSDEIQTFIQSILDTIGGVLFNDRKTALLKLTLIRGDYDPESVPVYDNESGLLEVRDAPIAAPNNLINEVQVTYRDPVTDEDRKVRVDNLAAKQASGGAINSLAKTYAGVPTGSLAGRLAQRDLRASGIGLRTFSLVFDRRGYEIDPGSVIRIRDLPRNIRDLPIRVARIEDGTLTNGQIIITAVQDVFGFPSSTFVGTEPPAWTPPNRKPCVGRQRVFELPYFMLNHRLSPADFAMIDDEQAFLGAVHERGQPLNAAYRIAVKDSAVDHGTEDPVDETYFCGYTP